MLVTGNQLQGHNPVALGSKAGGEREGKNAVAIGNSAATQDQAPTLIVLYGDGSSLHTDDKWQRVMLSAD